MFDTDVEAYFIETDILKSDRKLADFRELLGPEELRQMQRFVREQNRHDYLVAHALLRLALSRFSPVHPRDWEFVQHNGGRPEVAGPVHAPQLSFNLTHTEGLVACVIALNRAVGIDAESLNRSTDCMSIADQFFTSAEVRWLSDCTQAEQQKRFLKLWTLKEAYLKARGVGLSLPLDGISFKVDESKPIEVSFSQPITDNPDCWQFTQLQVSETHVLAVAANIPERRPLQIKLVPFFD